MAPAGPAVDLPARPYDRDDDLLEAVRRDGLPRLRVIRWSAPAVVIGKGGKQDLELVREAIAADGIPLLQRPGGGCSVILDPGNVIVSAVLPVPGIGAITSSFAALSAWMIAGLGSCGVSGVEQRGVSDLAIGDRKIGGSCIYRTRNLLYYSTTLLVEPDLDLIERYLLHPPREPDYRQGRPHREFLGSLRDGGWDREIPDLVAALEAALHPTLPRLS
ncbi:MAG: hypothetical protein ABIK96_07100 [bacterium]